MAALVGSFAAGACSDDRGPAAEHGTGGVEAGTAGGAGGRLDTGGSSGAASGGVAGTAGRQSMPRDAGVSSGGMSGDGGPSGTSDAHAPDSGGAILRDANTPDALGGRDGTANTGGSAGTGTDAAPPDLDATTRDAGAGNGCSGGVQTGPVTLASAQDSPSSIAVSATSVFWMTNASVMRVDKCGGAPTEVAAVPTTPVRRRMVVDDVNVYWTSFPEQAVMKAPLAGGTPVPLATDQVGVVAIAVGGGMVYWSTTSRTTSGDTNSISAAPATGGAPVELMSGIVALNDLAVDSTHIYWTARSAVMKLSLQGGSPVTLVPLDSNVLSTARGPALDADSVYFESVIANINNQFGDTFNRIPKTGGQATIIASGLYASSFAPDGSNVFWTSQQNGGMLMRSSREGNALTILTSGIGNGRVAVDATSVYWTSPATGSVQKLTPK